MNPSAVRPAPPRSGDASAAKICPRCRRANPAEAAYCYFDGGNLVGQQEGGQKLASDFLFPSGRRAKTLEDLADCASDDLVGWTDGDTAKPGYLSGFDISRAQADAMILNARVRAGWIEAPEPGPEAPAEEGEGDASTAAG